MSRRESGASLRALIVSYQFPPVGGAGVQRVTKLVKYLVHHGVHPTVLTASNPSVPLRDESLLADVPRDVEVIRTRTLEPDYAVKQSAWQAQAGRPSLRRRVIRAMTGVAKQLLVPDPQVLWQPTAWPAVVGQRGKVDVVLVSGPPFSQFALAGAAKVAGLPLVLDYRDEWSTYRTTYEMVASGFGRMVGDTMEPAVLRSAAFVTLATEEFRENLLRRYSFLDPGRVITIENGYDPDDFPDTLPSPPLDRYVLAYAGTVFRLTSMRGLLGAIRRLHRDAPRLTQRLSVQVMGRVVDTEVDAFEGTEALGVERLGYVAHDEVLPRLAAAHEVLCVLDEVPGNERIYPAKIFELMMLGRPLLTLSPPGALQRLVEQLNLGPVLPPRDEAMIARHLGARLEEFLSGKIDTERKQNPAIARFHRSALAARFADVLRAAADRG